MLQMPHTLLTGGTGILGQALQVRLHRMDRSFHATSRSPPADDGTEWVAMDLTDGTGIEAALDGVEVVIHCATAPRGDTEAVDVDGTERLLEAARNSDVSNFLYVSIVGIEDIPYSYYQKKLEAERLVEASEVPTTLLRATQFHQFLDEILGTLSRLPLWPVPTKLQFQPIDVGEVADAVCEHATAEPNGRIPAVGGPELMTLGEIAKSYREARGLRRPIVRLPVPGSVASAFRAGNATRPDRAVGTVTWDDWLDERYGPV